MGWMGRGNQRNYDASEEFAVGEVSRDVIGFDGEGLTVPVLGFLQPLRFEVGLAQHVVQRLQSFQNHINSIHHLYHYLHRYDS